MGAAQFLQALVPARQVERTAQQWREEVARLEQAKRAVQTRLDNNGVAVDQLALAAAQGNTEAQSALDITSAEYHELKLAVDRAERAVAQARRHLVAAEKAEAATKLKARVDDHARALREMIASAGEVETVLRSLVARLEEFHAAAGRARGGLQEATSGERFPLAVLGELDPAHIAGIFQRHLSSLGIAAALGVQVPGFNPSPVPSLVEAVRAVTRRCELTAEGVSRVLHGGPPAA